MKKYKKYFMSLGIIPLAAPIVVVSCSNAQSIPLGSLEPNSQVKDLQRFDLDKVANFSKAASAATRVINADAIKAINNIIVMMNAEPSWEWHTIGEPFIDGANVIRYVVWKAANDQGSIDIAESAKKAAAANNPHQGVPGRANNNAAEAELKNLINAIKMPQISDKSSSYLKKCVMDINKWVGAASDDKGNNFNKEFDIPRIYNWKTAPNGKGYDYYTLEQLKNTKPLRLNMGMAAFSQYRAQQIEWRGGFDMHQWKTTNAEMQKARPLQLINAHGIVAPPLVTKSNEGGGENYMFAFQADNKSDPIATASGMNFQYNIYEGVVSALDVFYDNNNADGGGLSGLDAQGNDILDTAAGAGHRGNEFSPTSSRFGYAVVAENSLKDVPYPYMVQSIGGSASYRTLQVDPNGLDGYKQDANNNFVYNNVVNGDTFTQRQNELLWLKNGLGLSDDQFKVLCQNLDFDSRYIYEDDENSNQKRVGQYANIILELLFGSFRKPGTSYTGSQARRIEANMEKFAQTTNNFQNLSRSEFIKMLLSAPSEGLKNYLLDASVNDISDFRKEDLDKLLKPQTSLFLEKGFAYSDPNYAVGLYDILGGRTAFSSLPIAATLNYQQVLDKFFVSKK